MTTAGTPLAPVEPLDGTDAQPASRTYRIFVRDLVLPWEIGIYDHEHDAPQRVRINIDLMVVEPSEPIDDKLGNVLSYAPLVEEARAIVERAHQHVARFRDAEREALLSLRVLDRYFRRTGQARHLPGAR